ncbi:MAG: ABC transporter ATP-binding protein [Bilifractor sp.]|jgi:ATP-binding cassette subfamily B multidrug efflux pump
MNENRTINKVLKAVGEHRWLAVGSFITAAVSSIAMLYVPVLFGDAIDGILARGQVNFPYVIGYLWKIALVVAIAALASWLMNLFNNQLVYRTIADIRRRAIRQIQSLPLSYLDQHAAGDIVQRVIGDADQLSDGLLLGATQLFVSVVTICATLVFMFMRNIEISCVIVLLTPLSFFAAKFIAGRSYTLFTKQTAERGEQTALINEMVTQEKTVQAFGYEKRASARFEVINEQLRKDSLLAVFYSSLTNPCTRAVNNLIYAIVVLIGAQRILAGALTVGGLTILLTYANQYMKPFNDLSSVVTELQNALACADRIFGLMEALPESKDSANALTHADGRVEISHLYFSYDKSKKLIEDFNLSVEPGQTIALVGPTGCGKTTFINLLMRFYEPDQGKIAVSGQDIQSISRHSLRACYGMVLQDTWLKNGTVRENIAFGRQDASDDEIIDAAKKTHAWEFIKRMPHGLDTVINDESLSAGEKQLLCIARVMLCRPEMLILDEATSSIDTRTELQIQAAFDALMEGRTSFTVAHRLSTIQNADLILVMKDGRIIERGKHEDLLSKNGFYAKLYQSQFANVLAQE